MKTILSKVEISSRMELALKALAARVQPSVPAVRCTVQHGGNDSFPWWVVARFANGGDESRVIDVSIDFRGTPKEWTIRADLARENGKVVREPAVLGSIAPANGAERNGGSQEAALRQLEDFLSEQADCLRQELA
jgi:hypothetical protein